MKDNEINKKYRDHERPRGKCYDCRIDYDDFPCDMVIQDDLWEKINPTFHEQAGLLCPNCICSRLINLGMTAVVVNVKTNEIE